MNISVVDLVNQTCGSDDNFRKFSRTICQQASLSPTSIGKEILAQIKKIIKMKRNCSASIKVRALHLLNVCIQTGNTQFLDAAQKKIMSRLKIMASYKKEAGTLFGRTSDASERQKAEEFLVVLLGYIKEWASKFGMSADNKMSVFYNTYNALVREKVTFPEQPKREQVIDQKPLQDQFRTQQLQYQAGLRPQYQNQIRKSENLGRPAPRARPNAQQIINQVQNMIGLAYQMMGNEQADQGTFKQILRNLQMSKQSIQAEIQRQFQSENDSGKVQALFKLIEEINQIQEIKIQPKKQLSDQDFEVDLLDMDEQVAVQLPNIQQKKDIIIPPQQSSQLKKLQSENSKYKALLQKRNSNDVLKDHQIKLLHAQNQKLQNQIQNLKNLLRQKQKQIKQFQQKKLPVQKPKITPQFMTGSPNILRQNPNPFDNYSSSSDSSSSSIAYPQFDNQKQCRIACSQQAGTIFDDQQIQIGIQFQFNQVLKGMMYIGNKSMYNITQVFIQVIDYPTKGVKMDLQQAEPSLISPQNQTIRSFSISITKPTYLMPGFTIKLAMNYLKTISLKLPASITRFMKPVQMNPEELSFQWEKTEYSEKSKTVQLHNINSMQELAQIIHQAGGFKLYNSQDVPSLNPTEIMASGLFQQTVFLTVGVENNMKANIKIRSNDPKLIQALMRIMDYQISGVIQNNFGINGSFQTFQIQRKFYTEGASIS